jgi:hypothetical protein
VVFSGTARDAGDLARSPTRRATAYGRTTFGLGALFSRRLIRGWLPLRAVAWPSVANGDPETTAWGTHAGNFGRLGTCTGQRWTGACRR